MQTNSYLVLFIGLLGLIEVSFANIDDEKEVGNVEPWSMGEESDDWKEAHYQVYAVEGKPLGHEKTLELLKGLDRLYQGREGFGSKMRRDKVARLLEVSKLSKNNCKRSYFDKLKYLIRYHDTYQLNIVPYLKHYLIEQKKFCEESGRMLKKESIVEKIKNKKRFGSRIFSRP